MVQSYGTGMWLQYRTTAQGTGLQYRVQIYSTGKWLQYRTTAQDTGLQYRVQVNSTGYGATMQGCSL